jgi:hypothetical protein
MDNVRRALVLGLLGIVLALGGLVLLASMQECQLFTYGGVVQPETPRTTCDPPWAPTLNPE